MRVTRGTLLLSAGLLTSCALIAAAGAPAEASGTSQPQPPSSSTPASYSVTVNGDVHLSGDTISQDEYNASYQPPECWLQPYFTAASSYANDDPVQVSSPTAAPDADSFWFYMADSTGLDGLLEHIPDSRQEVDQDFQQVQNGTDDVTNQHIDTSKYVWWAPNWLSGAQGLACAVSESSGLNNGYLDLEPQQNAAADANGEITGANLAALARAALRLSPITVHTEPAATEPSHVNVPTSVWVTYRGAEQPTDTATVDIGNGGPYLSATITTSAPKVSITTNAPSADYTESDNGTCSSADRCSVTFLDPSANTPFTITATATWTVSYTTSTGEAGTLNNPPSTVSGTRNVTVQEIQAVNG